ncbi:MAG TPA: thiamine pyrophosphate-dependent enzyme [Acetobacteraceae bacterium]|jgi:thiamine pyrophosphate-dependent acetolactate synthase large subunit-like protein|nr:thiamine pyrophosphate-dependent enzyme [Acetobacteraceae bacterium]
MLRNTKIMDRADLAGRLIARLRHDEAVIGGIGYANFDVFGAGHRPQNFYMLGSMGLAVPIALGLALAQPQRGVVAVEGDGSLLMQLGSLATVASVAPANLTIVVLDNAAYQITGGQPTATASAADLVEIARGAGLVKSAWAADESDFERLLVEALAGPGPSLIGTRIAPSAPQRQTPREPARIKDAFMLGLGTKSPF